MRMIYAKIAIAVLVGCILTVGVAWLIAARSWQRAGAANSLRLVARSGALLYQESAPSATAPAQVREVFATGTGWTARVANGDLQPLESPSSLQIGEISCGWPVTALSGQWRTDESSPSLPLYSGAIAWGWPGDHPAGFWRMLPCRPQPLGFALNSLLASAVLLPLLCVGDLRRIARVRRACCGSCGYPIERGSLLCPECGADRAVAMSA